jgi:hypothetical protein
MAHDGRVVCKATCRVDADHNGPSANKECFLHNVMETTHGIIDGMRH